VTIDKTAQRASFMFMIPKQFRLPVVLIVAVLVATCGRTSPPPKEDMTPPTVISQYPSNNSINVSINTSISIGFSEKMDIASIGPTTILVSDTSFNTVQGDISCDGMTATFKPKTALVNSTAYVVAVTVGVRDISGNTLAYPVNFVFTTGTYVDTIPPQVFSTAPTGTNVNLNAVIVVTFNEEMSPWKFTPQSIMVSDGTTSITGQLTTYSRMALFQPDQQLQKLRIYTVIVSGSIEDISGNPMGQSYPWQFETGDPDHEAPQVLNSTPTGSNALLTAPIIVTFNEAMLESSITQSTMILYDTKLSSKVTGTVEAKGATAIMTPAKALQYDTDYIVTLIPGYSNSPGIRDLAGNPLVANSPAGYTWTYRTEPSQNFIINATAGPGGSINPTSAVVSYNSNTTFTITPSTGHHILNVLVDDVTVGPVNSYSFTNVKANHSISASFLINSYALSIAKSGTGNGDVQTSPWKELVWLSSTATPTFNHGTTVTLTAYPGTTTAPSTFFGWSGCDSVSGAVCTVSMNSAKSVTASFTLNNYTLAVAKAGAGTGIVTSGPAGISCGTGCSADFAYGTSVTLTAQESSGSTFTGWSGEGCTGTGTCSLTMTASRYVSAVFTRNSYVVTATAGAGGSITPASQLVSYGSTTTFTVTPNEGYAAAVTGCGGTLKATNNTYTYTTGPITGTCTVIATFLQNAYTVTATAGSGGTITPASRVVSHGTTTAFTAGASPGYSIGTVSGCGGTLSGTTFTTGPITGACSVTAAFTVNNYVLSVTKAGTGTGEVTAIPGMLLWTGTTGTTSYPYNTSVVLIPQVNAGSTFAGWTGCDSVSGNQCNAAMNAARSITATFTFNVYTLKVTKTGTGRGNVIPGMGTLLWSESTGSAVYDWNTQVSLTAEPLTGSTFTGWSGEGCAGTGTCTATMTAARNVTAAFTRNIYAVTASAGAGGTITPASRLVTHGSTTIFTVEPNAGYSTGSVTGTCGGALSGTTFTTAAVTAPCTVTASFLLVPVNGVCGTSNNGTFPTIPESNLCSAGEATAVSGEGPWTWSCTGLYGGTTANCGANIQAYTVSAPASEGGTITPASRLVTHGSPTTFTVTANMGYTIGSVDGTCGGTLSGSTYTTNAIITPCTVTATFTLNSYTVSTSAGAGGTITPASCLVSHGSTTTFTVTANTGYSIGEVNGTCGGSFSGNTYTTNAIAAPCTVTASFTLNSYTVTASAGAGGMIAPASRLVNHGSTTTFTVEPNAGYSTGSVAGTCGGALSGTTFTTAAVTAPCTVDAAFLLIPVTGVCGTSNNGTYTTIPATNLCSAGEATAVSGEGPWTWSCTGLYGGSTASCGASIQVYTVSTSAGDGGTITPDSRMVSHGSETTFSVAAGTGSFITAVSGCGGTTFTNSDISVTTYEYATGPVTGDCTVTAVYDIAAAAVVGATQGIGFGSLSALSFLLNYRLFTDPFRRRRSNRRAINTAELQYRKQGIAKEKLP
jgi:hypothetical protein